MRYEIGYKNTYRGFTLVETLVAVAVLMIAIAGPLVIASKGLSAALFARDQMIASFLAQESMEVVKNTRDNYIKNGGGVAGEWIRWAQGTPGCIRPDSNSINACDASALSNVIQSCAIDSEQCRVYLSTDGYTTDALASGAKLTLFRRYFYITPKANSGGNIDALVTVVVSWNQGTIPNELRLTSELVDSIR